MSTLDFHAFGWRPSYLVWVTIEETGEMLAVALALRALSIAGARGLSGRNVDYLSDLVAHLREQGVADPFMEALLERVMALELVLAEP